MLLRTSVQTVLLRATSICLEFLIVVMLGRLLGPEGLGLYAFYYAAVRIASIPMSAGLPTLTVREVAKSHTHKQLATLKGYLLRSTQMVLSISGLVILAGLVLWVTKTISGEIFIFSLFLIPILSLGNLRGAALRGLGQVVRGQLPEYVVRPGIMCILLAGLAVFGGGQVTPRDAMLGILTASSVALLFGVYLISRALPQELRRTKPEFRTREWLTMLLPFTVISGLQVVNSQAGVTVLGAYELNADAGIFRVAQQISLVASFPITAMALALSPKFASLHAKAHHNQIYTLVKLSTCTIFVFCLLFSLIVIIAGDWAIEIIFGDYFDDTYHVLVILMIGQLFNCSTGALYPMLKMIGKEKVFAITAAIGAAINVILALSLTPIFGAEGAAVATAVSLLFVNVVLGVYSAINLKINPFPTPHAFAITYIELRKICAK